MRIGILTGGGDCPGLNAVIAAAVKKGILHYNDEFVGFLEGWRGVLENKTIPLTLETVDGIITRGGTILHSSRTNVRKIEGGIEKCVATLKTNKIDVIIATEAIDRLHTTADAHNRVIVCEVMGRDAGWIALTAGVAGNAHVVLVPERPIDLDHVCALLKYNHDHGKNYGIVVVAEGAKLPEGQILKGTKVDSFGHAILSGIGERLADLIEEKTGYETRSVNLGHTQRGGTPTSYDRMLATRYGLAAIDLVHKGEFGRMVVLKGTEIKSITIAEAVSRNRTLDDNFLDILKGLEPTV